MRTTASWPRRIISIGALLASFATLTAAANRVVATTAGTPTKDPRPGYTGDAGCMACHSDLSSTYAHTAHNAASQFASPHSVLGKFNTENLLEVVDPKTQALLPQLSFRMESKSDGFFETAVTGWEQSQHRRTERIDVVTGSGIRGQTFLYWQGDRLFELPVSYWSEGQRWINSPGYIDGTADFSRPINPGCLECHASYIQATSTATTSNSYVKDTLVPGIGCETCHGPGAAHAAKYAGRKPGAGSEAKKPADDTAILNPAKFSRDRQVDTCAVCHSGTARTALQPAFSFVPGKPLAEFFAPLPAAASDHPDVHGNQVGLLERSKCFQKSAGMSCSTCHDVHAPEKVAASYSEKCLACHAWQQCGVARTQGIAIKKNCVDCHMPVEPTNLIVSETAGRTVRAQMRNHWIKVYTNSKRSRPAGL